MFVEELIVGECYYVSYGGNVAEKVKLREVILLEDNKPFKVLFDRQDGTQGLLFVDEIGRSPEEAVLNEVTL